MISRPAPTPEDDDIQEVVSVKSEPAQGHQEYQDPSKRHNNLTVDKKLKLDLMNALHQQVIPYSIK